MGMLQQGRWVDQWYNTKESGGRFVRRAPQFRNWITADGAPGPSGEGGFKAEVGRYHLYVSLACPWAHRTLIFRTLKGLEELISVSVVHWQMAENGWTFQPGDGVVPDTVNGAQYLPDCRLPKPIGLCARPLSAAWCGGDGKHGAYQEPLLRQP